MRSRTSEKEFSPRGRDSYARYNCGDEHRWRGAAQAPHEVPGDNLVHRRLQDPARGAPTAVGVTALIPTPLDGTSRRCSTPVRLLRR
jgi:hypothetical protein